MIRLAGFFVVELAWIIMGGGHQLGSLIRVEKELGLESIPLGKPIEHRLGEVASNAEIVDRAQACFLQLPGVVLLEAKSEIA